MIAEVRHAQRREMTQSEKARAAAIFSVLGPLQKQQVITELIGSDVEHLTEAAKACLAVLTEQGDELDDQEETVDSMIDAWTNFTSKVSRVGSPYTSQSTVALEGVLQRLQSQVDPRGTVPFASSSNNPEIASAYFNNAMINSELYAVQQELQRRREVSGFLGTYGEKAARGRFGDDLTNKALQDLSANSKQTAADIREVSDRLAGRRPMFEG